MRSGLRVTHRIQRAGDNGARQSLDPLMERKTMVRTPECVESLIVKKVKKKIQLKIKNLILLLTG